MIVCGQGYRQGVKLLLAVWAVMCVVIRQAGGDAVPWNYGDSSDAGGPEHWKNTYPDCGGVMQSPIDITTEDILFDPHLQHFDFSDYKKTDGVNMELENVKGHTAEVVFNYTGTPIYLKGGNLPAPYKLLQFHFHWGKVDERGSEHTLNGQHYPMEIHFVHSQLRFNDATDAAPKPFGLAVLAYFFEVVKDDNPEFKRMLDHFDKIINASEKVEIETFPVANLLPKSNRYDFFRYQGSLTTPPCSESVIWSVGTDTIKISENQLNKFRSLRTENKTELVDDFRPLQSLDGRTVLTTHLMYYKGNDGATIVAHISTLLLALGLIYGLLF